MMYIPPVAHIKESFGGEERPASMAYSQSNRSFQREHHQNVNINNDMC